MQHLDCSPAVEDHDDLCAATRIGGDDLLPGAAGNPVGAARLQTCQPQRLGTGGRTRVEDQLQVVAVADGARDQNDGIGDLVRDRTCQRRDLHRQARPGRRVGNRSGLPRGWSTVPGHDDRGRH